MVKYFVTVSQPGPRKMHYIDNATNKRLKFDFGESNDELRTRFQQLAQNLYDNDNLIITAPERLVTEHFIVVDATKMHVKRNYSTTL